MKLCGMIMPGPVEKIFFRTCNARTPEILIANEEENAVSGFPIAPVPIPAPANLTAILPGSGGCPGMTKLCRMIMTGPTRKIFFRTCNNCPPLGLYILERHVMTNPKLTQVRHSAHGIRCIFPQERPAGKVGISWQSIGSALEATFRPRLSSTHHPHNPAWPP